eukprot:COSAG04_NODE_2412_length_4181_cov_3.810877_8_plen_121_part_01
MEGRAGADRPAQAAAADDAAQKRQKVGGADLPPTRMTRAAERLCEWCMEKDTSLLRAQVECQSFVIADMTDPDMPIRYASEGFLHLTGYTRAEIVNRNCRFLQGSAPPPPPPPPPRDPRPI